MTAGSAARPLLRVTGMSKTFPGLKALDPVSLEVGPGEIVVVVGHNGPRKSTLVKILAGSTRRTQARSSTCATRTGRAAAAPAPDGGCTSFTRTSA